MRGQRFCKLLLRLYLSDFLAVPLSLGGTRRGKMGRALEVRPFRAPEELSTLPVPRAPALGC